MLCSAKAFAKQAFEPVSFYCFGYLLTRYCEPQSWTTARYFTDQDRNAGVSTAEIVFKYLLKFASTRQSQLSRERLAGAYTHFKG